jgi:Rrf2 family protein
MAHLTASVEYGIHCLLWLVDSEKPLSGRDLADFQGVSPTFLAKILAKLEKAGIVAATEGVRGGYVLGRAARNISFLEIIDAIEGRKPLFDCQEVRERCALFGTVPPSWATSGVCGVHVVMLKAEKAMRDVLAGQSLGDIASLLEKSGPKDFSNDVREWFEERLESKSRKKRALARMEEHAQRICHE